MTTLFRSERSIPTKEHCDQKTARFRFIYLFVLIVEKYKISRDDIVVGPILGEGFFGEVHNGVYKSQVRFFI